MVNYLREYQVGHGVPKAQAYNVTMFIMAGLLAIGMICNWAVKPVDPGYYSKEEPIGPAKAPVSGVPAAVIGNRFALAAVWALVLVPLAWGVASSLGRAAALFGR